MVLCKIQPRRLQYTINEYPILSYLILYTGWQAGGHYGTLTVTMSATKLIKL